MGKVAIFLSDFHLGRRDELEDFPEVNEKAFLQFLSRQSAIHCGNKFDLVFLGDFFDLWQVASEKEKNASDSTEIEIEIREDSEKRRLQQIVGSHPNTFKALGQFLKDDSARRRIVFTTGNHDHSLIYTGLQDVIKHAVTRNDTELRANILFSDYYDEPELRTYAEHGNQFDDNNRYEDFASPDSGCPGYFFVRLFWNRLEAKDPHLEGVAWWNCFHYFWCHRLWKLLSPAWKFWLQYKKDPRSFKRIDVPGMPFFDIEEGKSLNAPITGKPLPEFPDILFNDRGHLYRIFSTEDATENLLRSFYHDPNNEDFRVVVDQILTEKFYGKPPTIPSEQILSTPEFGIFHDEYISGVTGMFAPEGASAHMLSISGSVLNDVDYDYVLLGHTHEDRSVYLGQLGAKYINTGSWAAKYDPRGKNVSRLCYVTIIKESDGSVEASQDYWRLI